MGCESNAESETLSLRPSTTTPATVGRRWLIGASCAVAVADSVVKTRCGGLVGDRKSHRNDLVVAPPIDLMKPLRPSWSPGTAAMVPALSYERRCSACVRRRRSSWSMAVSPSQVSNCSGVQPRSPTRSSQTSGWFRVQRMSVARAASMPGCERLRLVEGGDDRALVGVKVGLDERPQRTDLFVAGGGIPDHSEDRGDSLLDRAGSFREEAELALGIRLLEHCHVPGSLGDGRVGVVAFEREVPDSTKQSRLGVEREVDGLERDVRLRRDRGHRGCRVALRLEQSLGGSARSRDGWRPLAGLVGASGTDAHP